MRPHYGLGYCNLHWKRFKKTGDPGGVEPLKPLPPGVWTEWGYDSSGYLLRSRITETGRREFQRQHRVVMGEKLGRALLPHETVHHINGIKDDNRPENLELWTKSQPAGQRVADKIAWAIEFLAQYGIER